MHIDELEEYFKNQELPETFKLNSYTTITNCRNYVDYYVSTLRDNPGNKKYLPFYQRLVAFREELEKQKSLTR